MYGNHLPAKNCRKTFSITILDNFCYIKFTQENKNWLCNFKTFTRSFNHFHVEGVSYFNIKEAIEVKGLREH